MFFVLDIIQVTFVTVPVVDLPTSSISSQGNRHMCKNEQCYEAHAYPVPAVGV